MNHHAQIGSRYERCLGHATRAVLGAVLLLPLATLGCQRVLTITQDNYVNTGPQFNRPKENRQGVNLEVTVVCVHPHDLKNELNSALAPDAGITSDMWYTNRPQPGDKVDDEGHNRFRIPRNQIFLLTDEPQPYGNANGKCLRGAKLDGTDTRELRFDFNNLFSGNSVLYVFPKFYGPHNAEVLAVPPVKFDPPGDFREKLFVHIGVNDSNDNYGQYIENKTERVFGSDSDD